MSAFAIESAAPDNEFEVTIRWVHEAAIKKFAELEMAGYSANSPSKAICSAPISAR
jgi:hypothetical protein